MRLAARLGCFTERQTPPRVIWVMPHEGDGFSRSNPPWMVGEVGEAMVARRGDGVGEGLRCGWGRQARCLRCGGRCRHAGGVGSAGLREARSAGVGGRRAGPWVMRCDGSTEAFNARRPLFGPGGLWPGEAEILRRGTDGVAMERRWGVRDPVPDGARFWSAGACPRFSCGRKGWGEGFGVDFGVGCRLSHTGKKRRQVAALQDSESIRKVSPVFSRVLCGGLVMKRGAAHGR